MCMYMYMYNVPAEVDCIILREESDGLSLSTCTSSAT